MPLHHGAMTHDELTFHIENNRIALLRLVTGWLLLALFVLARHDKPLPRRISLFAATSIWKAEKAAYFLTVATARALDLIQSSSCTHKPVRLEPGRVDLHAHLTLSAVIRRLRAVR